MTLYNLILCKSPSQCHIWHVTKSSKCRPCLNFDVYTVHVRVACSLAGFASSISSCTYSVGIVEYSMAEYWLNIDYGNDARLVALCFDLVPFLSPFAFSCETCNSFDDIGTHHALLTLCLQCQQVMKEH